MIFRNDDLCVDSDITKFREIQGIMEEFGIQEIYSVIPYGRNLYMGSPFEMPLENLNDYLGKEPVYTNHKVDEFIKESLKKGHKISLHGWTHTRIALYTYEEQKYHIEKAKKMLEDYYGVWIEYFVPPYNNYNDSTIRVCKELGMKILAGNENQLEWLVRDNNNFTKDEHCWYHAWRFYLNGLTPNKLREYLCRQLGKSQQVP